jgi:hypothetical protein
MSGPFSFSRKLKPSVGRAWTRALGWGDRAVVFHVVDHIEDGRRVGSKWEAKRGERHATVSLDVYTVEPSWFVSGRDGDALSSLRHHDSLEAALYAARAWLLEVEA